MFEAKAKFHYGPVKYGGNYVVVDEGYDWYLAKVRGKRIYCPKWVFNSRFNDHMDE